MEGPRDGNFERERGHGGAAATPRLQPPWPYCDHGRGHATGLAAAATAAVAENLKVYSD